MRKALLIALAMCFVAGTALAFHDGGVAHCNGCHTMHNSQNGALVDIDSPDGNPWLLVDSTPSDVCIACHDHLDQTLGHDVMTPPAEKGAGNFVFLLEDNLNDGHGGAHQSDQRRRGGSQPERPRSRPGSGRHADVRARRYLPRLADGLHELP